MFSRSLVGFGFQKDWTHTIDTGERFSLVGKIVQQWDPKDQDHELTKFCIEGWERVKGMLMLGVPLTLSAAAVTGYGLYAATRRILPHWV